jgi:uncharacterized protein
MRLTVRVRPGSSRTHVGGRYGESDPPVLVVAVNAPAAAGAANRAAIAALADAFGARPSDLRIVSGLTSRTKVVEVDGGDPAVLGELLAG